MELRRTKNTATRVVFPLVDADGDTVTGAASLDSETTNWNDGANPGSFADCTNEATEIGTTGVYYLQLTASEMDFDYVYVQVKTSSAKTQHIIINTMLQRSDAIAFSGDTTAADNAELFFDGTGYAGGTTKLQVDAVALSGDTTAADNAELFFDGTGYAGGTTKLQVEVASGGLTAASIASDALTAAKFAADVTTELRSLASGTSDSGSTTTMVDSARSEADDDYWKGCLILFTSGTIAGQCRLITGFTASSDTITFAPATTQAVSTQTYEILPNGRIDLHQWQGTAPNALISGRVDANAQVVGDKTGYTASVGSGGITTASFAAGAIDAAAIADNAIDAGALAADCITAAKIANGAIDAATFAAGAIDAAAIATDAIGSAEFSQAAADKVWSTTTRALTDKAGFSLSSAGVTAVRSLATGTADSGSTTTIVDAERTEADNDYWKGALVLFTSGSIVGQVRLITGFTASSDTLTFAPATTQAVGTNTYEIIAFGRADVGLWNGSAPNNLISGRVDANAQVVGDKTGYTASVGSGGITASSFAGGAIDAAAIANGAIDAATFAAGAIDAAAIANGAIDAATFAAGAIDAAAIASDAIGSAEFAQAAADKIWASSTRSLTDKAGFALSSAGVTAVRSLASGTADSGSSTTIVDTERTEADADYWKGKLVLFTSGSIAGQVRLITGFNAGSDTITFAPATTQAVSTNTYEILAAGRADIQLWLGSLVNALISGRVDANAQVVGASAISSGSFVAGAIDASVIADGAIDAGAIASDAITAAKIANGAIDAATFAAGAIDAAAIATGAIDADALASDTITAAKIANGAIDAATFAAGAVDAAALATDAANEIRDAVWAKAMTELSAVPGVTDDVQKALQWLFLLARNKITQTSTTQTLRNDADSATIGASTHSDDGTTHVRGEFA